MRGVTTIAAFVVGAAILAFGVYLVHLLSVPTPDYVQAEPIPRAPVQESVAPDNNNPDALIDAHRPADEDALMHFYDDAFEANEAAPNDIVKERVVAKWDKAFCDAIGRIHKFRNWTGKVRTIRENGYFEVDLGGYITVTDIEIRPGSPMFDKISTLSHGQAVSISGKFLHGDESCDVFVNRDFAVHLDQVSPL